MLVGILTIKVPSSRRRPRIFLAPGLDYAENDNIIMI